MLRLHNFTNDGQKKEILPQAISDNNNIILILKENVQDWAAPCNIKHTPIISSCTPYYSSLTDLSQGVLNTAVWVTWPPRVLRSAITCAYYGNQSASGWARCPKVYYIVKTKLQYPPPQTSALLLVPPTLTLSIPMPLPLSFFPFRTPSSMPLLLPFYKCRFNRGNQGWWGISGESNLGLGDEKCRNVGVGMEGMGEEGRETWILSAQFTLDISEGVCEVGSASEGVTRVDHASSATLS